MPMYPTYSMQCSVNVMCNNAGDLLGGEAAAPAAAAGSAGGIFAGLDVGTSTNTSNQPPSNSGTPSTSTVPQSPFDALAGLQGPQPSHLGIVWHLAVWPMTQSVLGYVSSGSVPQRSEVFAPRSTDRNKREVYAVRRHNRSLCTQKQPGVSTDT